MGETSVPEALEAERAGAAHLLTAQSAAISVNGNVAVLAADQVKRLAAATGAVVEVNLFHRTDERIRKIVDFLHSAGLRSVLGTDPDASIPGLEHPRALSCRKGIYGADVVLVPLEDGDRAAALARMEKVVIAVDLNPLSRTSQAATIAVVDDVARALENMARFAEEMKEKPEVIQRAKSRYEKDANMGGIMGRMRDNLGRSRGE